MSFEVGYVRLFATSLFAVEPFLLALTSIVIQLFFPVTDITSLSLSLPTAAHNTHSSDSQKNSNHYMMVLPPHPTPFFLLQTNHVTTQALQDIKITSLVSNIPNWTLYSDCIFYYPLLVLLPLFLLDSDLWKSK
jgi:hypothetical protein